jgi:Flp pilus assembly protein TadG
VELALLSVVLFPLLFGVLQYGLYFNDYLQVRSGVRQGARTAVVLGFSQPGCTTGTDDAKIVCYTKKATAPSSGPVAVYVKAPSGWGTGKALLVCATVKTVNMVGFSMPNNGYAKAITQMSIEQETPLPTGTFTAVGAGDVDPTGAAWAWCTA